MCRRPTPGSSTTRTGPYWLAPGASPPTSPSWTSGRWRGSSSMQWSPTEREARDHMKWTFTSESVTEGHPDKMADQISDAILDAILAVDPTGRVACATLLTTGLVMVA